MKHLRSLICHIFTIFAICLWANFFWYLNPEIPLDIDLVLFAIGFSVIIFAFIFEHFRSIFEMFAFCLVLTLQTLKFQPEKFYHLSMEAFGPIVFVMLIAFFVEFFVQLREHDGKRFLAFVAIYSATVFIMIHQRIWLLL